MKKLLKGLRRDERPLDQPNGTWRAAKNKVVYNQFESISDEDGVLDITPVANGHYYDFPIGKIVIGTIVTNIETIYFFASTNIGESEIGKVDKNNNYLPILKDSLTEIVLNFDINYPIKGTFETKYNDELIIAFSDYYNPPRILNTNCIPFRVLLDYTINPLDTEKAINSLQQFPNMKSPLIKADTDLRVFDGSGVLKSGTYYPIVSYELADGTNTFWCKIFNPIPLYVDAATQQFIKVGGSLGGIQTNKYIDITFTEVDTNFKYLRLGYIYKENGISRAFYSSKQPISSSTVQMTITGAEATLSEITLDEVLIPNAVYIKAKGITNLQGRLYEGNLEQEDSLNLQNIVNEITINWVKEKQISLNSRVLNTQSGGSITTYGSYKDPSLVFFDKSFKAGECYALYLVGKLKNGLYTEAFHIPGRDLTTSDRTPLNGTNAEIDAISLTGVKNFQLNDTTNSSGQMGAWENETEEYPLDISGNIHPDYSNITGITPTNRKVRHHVFPDLRTLKGYGHNFQIPVSSATCTMVVNSGGLYGNPDRFTLYPFFTNIVSGSCFSYTEDTDESTKISGFTSSGTLDLSFDFGDNGGTSTAIVDSNSCLLMTNTNAGDDCVSHLSIGWSLYFNGVIIADYTYEGVNTDTVGVPGGIQVNNFPVGIQHFILAVSPGDVINIHYKIGISTNNNSCGNAYNIGTHNGCFIRNHVATFSLRNVDTEVLGIQISNLNIPSNIADKLDSWEIFYAKRTQSNIRIAAQDMLKEGRYHNFDLISTKAVAQANYLKPQLEYNGVSISGELQDTLNTPNIETAYPTEEYKVINVFQYCGENTSIPQNNANRAENIFIAGGVGDFTSNTIVSAYQNNNTLTDICIYRKNMYYPFDVQEIISTGYCFKVNTSGVQPIQKVFGGDTFINIFGFRDSTISTNNYLLSCESASNIGLRYDEPSLNKTYYPKYPIATPSYYKYNRDYNCLNDLIAIISHYTNGNCNTDKITKLHTRVIYSVVDANESKFLNWRVFKAGDYYEMPKNKGTIWSLLGVDRKLFIHHEYSLFVAEIKDSIGSGLDEVFIKSSNVFDRPPLEALSINEGYGGTQSHFAIIYCKLGYCFIDRNAKKVFIFNQQLKEISNEGLYNFFKSHGESLLPSIDNPYIGNGYMMAFDETYNRLIITKKDSNYEFTLSFCNSVWISEHDYSPHSLVYNRSGLFAVDNNLNKLFKHNNPLNKCIYYDGQIKESYIDVVFNESPDITKTLRSVNWLSDTTKLDGTVLREETLTHIIVFNNSQCSGIIDLKANKNLWFGSDARNVEETWNFNDFRDLLKNNTLPILDNKNELILSNINNSKSWFDKSLFISKFVIIRFIKDNLTQNNLHIIGVNATFKKSDRV
jgi:hypothetical protein